MTEPIPCRCGATPNVVPMNPETEGNAWATVRCSNSRCAVIPFISDGELVADDRGSDAYKEAAILRWNAWMK